MKSKFFFSALPVLFAGATLLTACSTRPTIDFEQCVTVDFTGYEDEGRVVIHTDNDYILSLLGDMNTLSATSLLSSFSIDAVENNGELSNGDVVTVIVNTNQTALDNAKVNVKNTELHFTVEGLEEKPKLDVFADVSLSVTGASPYCKVSAEYSGDQWLSGYSFNITSVDGEQKEYYQNGDKVIISLTQDALDSLKDKGNIEETSREFTIQSDSAYILSAADLTADNMTAFRAEIDEYLNSKINDLLNNSDNTSKWNVISGVSGINSGALAASSCGITGIENVEYHSAYAGVAKEKGAFGNIKEYKYAYIFYNADISYFANSGFSKKEDTVNGAFIVRVTDPMITASGEITYTDISLGAKSDLQTAINDRITENFSKLT